MRDLLSTKEAARLLGVRPSTLSKAVWDDRLSAPERIGRNFVWTQADVQRAKRAMGLVNRPAYFATVDKGAADEF